MKQIKANDLQIGTRYWLDSVMDVSGVYIGRGQRDRLCFNEIEGNNCYVLQLGKEVIPFAPESSGLFFLIEK